MALDTGAIVTILLSAFIGPITAGLILWYFKLKVEDFIDTLNEAVETAEQTHRLVTGTQMTEGLIDVAEAHDNLLDEADVELDTHHSRLSILEKRLDRLADKADARNGLSEESNRLREVNNQIRQHTYSDGEIDFDSLQSKVNESGSDD